MEGVLCRLVVLPIQYFIVRRLVVFPRSVSHYPSARLLYHLHVSPSVSSFFTHSASHRPSARCFTHSASHRPSARLLCHLNFLPLSVHLLYPLHVSSSVDSFIVPIFPKNGKRIPRQNPLLRRPFPLPLDFSSLSARKKTPP